jgi:transcription termination factor NusB
MNLQTRKLNIIAYLAQLQDESFFEQLERLILKNQSDIEPNYEPFSLEQLISRIQISENDFEQGKFQTQEELEKNSNNW